MNDIKKIEKINLIREEIGVKSDSDNEFFTKEEISLILEKLNPNFDTNSVSVEQLLPESIDGWYEQKTIGNHPNVKNADLILNLLRCNSKKEKAVHKVFTGDRLQIRESMAEHRLEDPVTDTDCRQTEIWNLAEKMGLDVQLHMNYDFKNNLCDRSDKYYQMAQTRVKSEDADKINNLFQRFYMAKEKQKRPSLGVILNGKLYVGSGNHRAFTHKWAQKAGHDSIGSVLIFGNNVDEKIRMKFLLEMGTISNKDTGDQTTEETMLDIAHQVKNYFNYLCYNEKGYSSYTEAQCIEWAEEWLKANKAKYHPDGMKSVRKKIANIAFSSNISQSIPLPDEDEHPIIWGKFFPNDTWHPSSQTSVIQKVQSSNKQNLQKNLFLNWKHQDFTKTRVPKRMWLLARVGSTIDASITSLESVQQGREEMIAFLTEENTNKNMQNSSFPIYDKIVFVRQVQGLEEEAYIWNVSGKCFIKVLETT